MAFVSEEQVEFFRMIGDVRLLRNLALKRPEGIYITLSITSINKKKQNNLRFLKTSTVYSFILTPW